MITNIGVHDVDHVSLRDTETLAESGGSVRTLVIKSGESLLRIALFASNPKLLDVVKEG